MRRADQKRWKTLRKILDDNLPGFIDHVQQGRENSDTSTITDKDCVNLLEEFLSLYQSRLSRKAPERRENGKRGRSKATSTPLTKRRSQRTRLPSPAASNYPPEEIAETEGESAHPIEARNGPDEPRSPSVSPSLSSGAAGMDMAESIALSPLMNLTPPSISPLLGGSDGMNRDYEMDGIEEAGRTNENDEMGTINEIDETHRDDEMGTIDEADETDRDDDKADETNKGDEIDTIDELEEAERDDEADGTDETDEINRHDETDGMKGASTSPSMERHNAFQASILRRLSRLREKIEEEVATVANILYSFKSQRLSNATTFVFRKHDVYTIAQYLQGRGETSALNQAMINCQIRVVKLEMCEGMFNILAMISKVTFINWYHNVKRTLTRTAWTQIRDDLENSYLVSHSIKARSSHRSFLSRCRTLERFLHLGGDRVNGLKFLLFASKLRTYYCSTLKNKRQRHILEMEVGKVGFVFNIEKAVDLCCRDWFKILMNVYPDYLLPFTTSHPDDINRTLSGNVDQQDEVNCCLESEIFEFHGKTYQSGNMLSGDELTEGNRRACDMSEWDETESASIHVNGGSDEPSECESVRNNRLRTPMDHESELLPDTQRADYEHPPSRATRMENELLHPDPQRFSLPSQSQILLQEGENALNGDRPGQEGFDLNRHTSISIEAAESIQTENMGRSERGEMGENGGKHAVSLQRKRKGKKPAVQKTMIWRRGAGQIGPRLRKALRNYTKKNSLWRLTAECQRSGLKMNSWASEAGRNVPGLNAGFDRVDQVREGAAPNFAFVRLESASHRSDETGEEGFQLDSEGQAVDQEIVAPIIGCLGEDQDGGELEREETAGADGILEDDRNTSGVMQPASVGEDSDSPSGNEDGDVSNVTQSAFEGEDIVGEEQVDNRQNIVQVGGLPADEVEFGGTLHEEIEDSDSPPGEEDRDASSVTQSTSEGGGIVGEERVDDRQDAAQLGGLPAVGGERERDTRQEEIENLDGPSEYKDQDVLSGTQPPPEFEGIVGDEQADHRQEDTEPIEMLPSETADPVSHIDVAASSGIEERGRKRKFEHEVGDESRGVLKKLRIADELETTSREPFDEEWWNQYLCFDNC